MTEIPRILLTNDDGIDSPGIRSLAVALAGDYDLVVAAPMTDRSGSGTGIGRFDPRRGVDLTSVDLDGVPAYCVDGPPGLVVTAAALGAFGRPPDLVVSGINAGINTGHSVIHSGTVGAALTARTFRMKGLAVSLAQSHPWQWDTAVSVAQSVIRWMLDRRQGPQVLNVNVPGVPVERVEGVHWADLDDFGYFRVASAEVEEHRLQFEVRAVQSGSDPASDTRLCSENRVTLTPLSAVEPAPFPALDPAQIWRPSPATRGR